MSCVHLHAGILHKLRHVYGFAFTKLQSGKYFVIKILDTEEFGHDCTKRKEEFGHVCCRYPCFAERAKLKAFFQIFKTPYTAYPS